MIRKMLRNITEKYHLNAIPTGEFSKMKIKGMTFDIWAFHAAGLGHVSAMTATGFFGLMKMDTLIINPTEKDMPLFSYDRVRAMGKDRLICELYDTMLVSSSCLRRIEEVKTKFEIFDEHDLGQHWYDSIKMSASLAKKLKKSLSPFLDACSEEYLQAYLEMADNVPYCDPDAKREKASVYVEGLLANGGPSTDIFKKAIGQEKTELLFRHFLFGTTR